MKIYREENLSNFEFWSGACANAAMLTAEELDNIGDELEMLYPDGMSETEINDIFWFDFGFACELIGLEYDEEEDEINR